MNVLLNDYANGVAFDQTSLLITTNPASGKVLEKIGLKKEAILIQHLKKDGQYYDIPLFSIFRNEYI